MAEKEKIDKKKSDRDINESGTYGSMPGAIRIVFVALVTIALIIAAYFTTRYLQNASLLLGIIGLLLNVLVFLHILNNISSPATRTAWMVVVFILPYIGCLLYVLWGNVNIDKKEKGFARMSFDNGYKYKKFDTEIKHDFGIAYPQQRTIAHMLENSGFPLYKNTSSEYFGLGDTWWPALLEDLKSAEKFIFMEYFIVDEGKVWDSIMQILIEKARSGVEVKFMYDDLGSLTTYSNKFTQELRKAGVQVIAFNPVNRYISSLYLNYRNHQKITVVDGRVGHVGGTNLADEYANLYPKHGHWKDTCMRVYGDTIWALTIIFLQMWDMSQKELTPDYELYRGKNVDVDDGGYYIPIADGPANNPLNPAMDLYKAVISNSKDYCYICSPYLVIDDDMIDRLTLAARSGVDIRLILPHVPDHWYVNLVTHSFYSVLLEAGVRIYEYSPGYIHAKMIASDDITAILGSVNLDFRSFFMHYEDCIWMCDTPMVREIRDDILDTFKISQEVNKDEWIDRPWYRKLLESVLRIFAPMM